MRLFVDTGGWVGLFAEGDKYHLQASRAFRRIQGQPVQLLTSDYVFDETLTHLQKFYGRQTAIRCGRWILTSYFVEMARIDDEVWETAWEMFQAYRDKEWSFTDCTSFVLMQQHHLWQVFAFDHHFEQAGFQLWPR
jgi:predicted nucleic acid-binding protein